MYIYVCVCLFGISNRCAPWPDTILILYLLLCFLSGASPSSVSYRSHVSTSDMINWVLHVYVCMYAVFFCVLTCWSKVRCDDMLFHSYFAPVCAGAAHLPGGNSQLRLLQLPCPPDHHHPHVRDIEPCHPTLVLLYVCTYTIIPCMYVCMQVWKKLQQ